MPKHMLKINKIFYYIFCMKNLGEIFNLGTKVGLKAGNIREWCTPPVVPIIGTHPSHLGAQSHHHPCTHALPLTPCFASVMDA
jgi:hypothetical protein